MKRVTVLLAAIFLTPAAADASVITFTNFSGPQLTTYTEAGFTVSVTSGVFPGSSYGNPGPSISTPQTSTISIMTTIPGLFTFADVDIAVARGDSNNSFSYDGSLAGLSLFSAVGSVSADNVFHTVASQDSRAIDTLTITINGQGSTPALLDNINVSAVIPAVGPNIVPEPSSLTLFGIAGVASLGLKRLRRRRGSAVVDQERA